MNVDSNQNDQGIHDQLSDISLSASRPSAAWRSSLASGVLIDARDNAGVWQQVDRPLWNVIGLFVFIADVLRIAGCYHGASRSGSRSG